jgi:hypothetical protein
MELFFDKILDENYLAIKVKKFILTTHFIAS